MPYHTDRPIRIFTTDRPERRPKSPPAIGIAGFAVEYRLLTGPHKSTAKQSGSHAVFALLSWSCPSKLRRCAAPADPDRLVLSASPHPGVKRINIVIVFTVVMKPSTSTISTDMKRYHCLASCLCCRGGSSRGFGV